jgi:signal transduction histidine kinase
MVVVVAVVELNIVTATGPGQKPLNAVAYLVGAVLPLPVLLRRRWPLRALLGCSLLLVLAYLFDRRNISPAPLLSLPLYDAAVAGFLIWAIIIPAVFMVIGLFVVAASTNEGLTTLAANFLLPLAVLFLAIMLGEVVRGRRALAAETADRLRLAEEERVAEAARLVAEERLRIARDLHDTIAHSMATITVQAGSALHVLDGGGGNGAADLREALAAIRATSKSALIDIRATLGGLRRDDGGHGGDGQGTGAAAGLARLPALTDAVTAAGAPVTLAVDGDQIALPPEVDQAAYRILQESLTNVLRHAGPEASATVRLRYEPDGLTITVSDDGGCPTASSTPRHGSGDGGMAGGYGRLASSDGGMASSDGGMASSDGGMASGDFGPAGGDGGMAGVGHGITGMTERAAALGGELTAGPGADGGFEVVARFPVDRTGGTS